MSIVWQVMVRYLSARARDKHKSQYWITNLFTVSMDMTQAHFTWKGYDENDASHRILQGFLLTDVQYSPRHAENIRFGIQDYLRGIHKEFSGRGNGYLFSCNPEGFFIDSLLDGNPLTPTVLDYCEVIQALVEWTAHCDQLSIAAEQDVNNTNS